MAVDEKNERWFGPQGATRYHFFDKDLRSLCKKWMLWRDPTTVGLEWGMAQGNATTDCAGCTRALALIGRGLLETVAPEEDT